MEGEIPQVDPGYTKGGKLTIKNLKDGRVITRFARQANLLLQAKYWVLVGSESEAPVTQEKKEESVAAPVAEVEVPEVEINDYRDKYKELTGKKPYHGWNIEQLVEKISNYGKEN